MLLHFWKLDSLSFVYKATVIILLLNDTRIQLSSYQIHYTMLDNLENIVYILPFMQRKQRIQCSLNKSNKLQCITHKSQHVLGIWCLKPWRSTLLGQKTGKINLHLYNLVSVVSKENFQIHLKSGLAKFRENNQSLRMLYRRN